MIALLGSTKMQVNKPTARTALKASTLLQWGTFFAKAANMASIRGCRESQHASHALLGSTVAQAKHCALSVQQANTAVKARQPASTAKLGSMLLRSMRPNVSTALLARMWM